MKKTNKHIAPYQRSVKFRKSYYQCPYTSDWVQGPINLLVKVPSLTIEGDWLKEAGFRCNSKATVTVSEGCLVIRPD